MSTACDSRANIPFTEREFERQADSFAIEYCKRNHINGKHFINLYKRLQQKVPANIPSLLSTHPPDEERIALFMAIANP